MKLTRKIPVSSGRDKPSRSRWGISARQHYVFICWQGFGLIKWRQVVPVEPIWAQVYGLLFISSTFNLFSCRGLNLAINSDLEMVQSWSNKSELCKSASKDLKFSSAVLSMVYPLRRLLLDSISIHLSISVFSMFLYVLKVRGVVKKRPFYGQADRKGWKCWPIFPLKFDSLIHIL